MKLLIQLVREILHLSGKSQGKVREFQKPMAVATMYKLRLIFEDEAEKRKMRLLIAVDEN